MNNENEQQKVRFRVMYEGGSASDGLLDIYDASRSMYGLSRALAITVHAYLNAGDVRKHGDRAKGAQILIAAPRRGCFELLPQILIGATQNALGGAAVIALPKFLGWVWSAAINKRGDPPTGVSRKLGDRVEPFLSEISASLEQPLADMHRPIEADSRIKVDITKPQGDVLVSLDRSTFEYVKSKEDPEIRKNRRGNVTRYNVVSGYGRFYDDALKRIVSFKIAENVTRREKGLLTWSLHMQGQNESGKILMDVHRVLSSRNEVKRYIVVNVRKAD